MGPSPFVEQDGEGRILDVQRSFRERSEIARLPRTVREKTMLDARELVF